MQSDPNHKVKFTETELISPQLTIRAMISKKDICFPERTYPRTLFSSSIEKVAEKSFVHEWAGVSLLVIQGPLWQVLGRLKNYNNQGPVFGKCSIQELGTQLFFFLLTVWTKKSSFFLDPPGMFHLVDLFIWPNKTLYLIFQIYFSFFNW